MSDRPTKTVSEKTAVSGIQIGLLLGVVTLGAGFVSHELDPIREDMGEIKLELREIRKQPIPSAFLARFDDLVKRVEILEGD